MEMFKKNAYKIGIVAVIIITIILFCVLKFYTPNSDQLNKKGLEDIDEYSVQQQLMFATETIENAVESGKNGAISNEVINRSNKDEGELEGTVVVNYIDENGEKIIESTIKNGKVGQEYDIERPYIKGYTRYGEEPITRAGVYGTENINVDFVYRPVSGEVLAKVNQEGEDGALSNEVNVLINNPKLQNDYRVRIITKDKNGNEINGGEFTVKQGDRLLRKGKVLKGSFYVGKIAINKEENIVYNVEQTDATIGYKGLQEVINLNLNSTWNDEDSRFDMTLDDVEMDGVDVGVRDVKKIVTKKDGDNEVTEEVIEKEIVIEVINEKYEDMYKVEVVNKSKDAILTGGKFKVEDGTKTIVDDFIVNESLFVGDFKITADGTDRFVVYETGTVSGYKKTIDDSKPGIVVVTKKFNNDKGIYEVTAQDNGIPGFSAIMGEDRKLTIYIESEEITVQKPDPDPEPTPDVPKKYDLCIRKFIAEIDGEKTINREPKVTIENNKIKYTQSSEIEKVANKQKVTYILRTYNESNVIANGKRIIEYIPDGLEFLPDNEKNIEYGWKLYKQDKDGDLIQTKDITEATVVATDYLIDKEISSFDTTKDKEPKYSDVQVVFEVNEKKITSSDRIIENKVKIQRNENDDNPENDETSEKIYVKYFDLGVTKYIKEVKISNSKGEKVQTVGEDKKGQLLKLDIDKDLIEDTKLTITYVLKVTNIGEIEGYATELVDYIPQDFVLVEDGTWTQKDGKAVTSKLENKLLQPGESTSVEIEFNWKLTLDNIGSRINEGEITKYENEYKATAITTNENKGRIEMLATVRTGSVYVYITIGVLVVLFMTTGATLICKYKKN